MSETLVFKNVSDSGSSFVQDPVKGDVSPRPIANVTKVPCTSVDEVLKGDGVTLIKFDIEGSELAGLEGARKTIEKYHPTLAIAIYHKPEDIVELPNYIKEIAPGYRFYLRCYNSDASETVLYAVWPR